MSESRLKRLSEQLAEEPREKLLEIIERQQGELEKAEAANLGLSVRREEYDRAIESLVRAIESLVDAQEERDALQSKLNARRYRRAE